LHAEENGDEEDGHGSGQNGRQSVPIYRESRRGTLLPMVNAAADGAELAASHAGGPRARRMQRVRCRRRGKERYTAAPQRNQSIEVPLKRT